MKIPLAERYLSALGQEPPLAWSQLTHQKIRLLVALTGIAFADILIFTQLGFKTILFEGTTRIHEHLRGDLVLINQRTETISEGKTFSRRHLYQAAAVEGVASASPFYYSNGGWVNPWTKEVTSVAVLAFDPVQPVMDLPEVNQQLEQIKLPNVVLFDSQSQPDLGPVTESFAKGETVTTEISERRVKVGGIFTLGSSLFTYGHVVTSDWNYLRLFGQQSIDNPLVGVITLEPEVDSQTVLANIQVRLPDDVKVITLPDFVKLEEEVWAKRPAGVIFNFGTLMGFVVGVVIVYQVLYSDVNDHLKEYATLKAMGYPDLTLLSTVFQEGIMLAVLGFLPGLGCSVGIYALLANLTRIPLGMRMGVVLRVFLLTLLMCAISGVVAMRKLQSADPADVF